MRCLSCGRSLCICNQLGGQLNGIGIASQAAYGNSIQTYNALMGAQLQAFAGQPASIAQYAALASALGYSTEPVEKAGTRFGEIVGWRIWRLKKGFLESFSAERVWAPNEAMSGVPGDHDGLGVWCFKTKSAALKKLISDLTYCDAVLGSVELYGEVVEHELGYRGEYAQVASIDLVMSMKTWWDWGQWSFRYSQKEGPKKLVKVRERYGINNG